MQRRKVSREFKLEAINLFGSGAYRTPTAPVPDGPNEAGTVAANTESPNPVVEFTCAAELKPVL
jgi:hypothetical protein